jgi:hypothetical protein
MIHASFCFSEANRREPCNDALNMAIDYYESRAYTKSIKALDSILHECDEISKFEVNKYLAFNYVAIGDEPLAIVHFKRALSLHPQYEIAEDITSPDIHRVFEDARKELAHESGGCSCFIPGIGQFMKGEDNKGRAIIAASGVTLTTAIITWAVADSKHNHYLSLGPEDIDDMDRAYEDYNRWHKASIVTATTFVAIYMYSIFDAILTRKPNNHVNDKNPGFNIDSDGESVEISYRIGL